MMDPTVDNAIERMGEAMFDLSDSIRKAGALMNEETSRRYQNVVSAWDDLTDALDAFAERTSLKLTGIEEMLAEIKKRTAA